LAGALGMRAQSFAIFNAAGATLWAGASIVGGLIFHVQIQHLLGSLSELGRLAVWLVAALVALYVAWRMARRWRELRLHARMPRVRPDELAEMIEQGRELLILDVRTQGPGLPLRERISKARHIDLAAIETVSTTDWADNVPIVIYCDCPNDASATKAAGLLSKRGVGASILSGGMDDWVQAGYPLEAV
jgi:rhodanese-related sulfurtransferase